MLPPSVYGNTDIPAEEEALLGSMTDLEIAAGVAKGSISYRFEQKLREQDASIKSAINTQSQIKEDEAKESRTNFQELIQIQVERTLGLTTDKRDVSEEFLTTETRRDWCGTSKQLDRMHVEITESEGTD